jgi:STE24 endopeptidase
MTKLRLIIAMLLLAFIPSSGISAQESVVDEVSAPTTELPAVDPAPPVATLATVAAPFDSAVATRAYLDRLSPEERARSDAYFEGGYWLQLWGFLAGLGVAWLLLGTGLSRRMRDWAGRLTRRKPLQTGVYTVLYVLLTTVIFFPLTVYQGFFREHQYDLATQTFGEWMRDQLVGLGVNLVLLSLLLIVLYGVFRRAPRTWWLWGTGVAVGFLVLLILIAPVYLDPLFNTYEPLEDARVKEDILSMARASGIEVDDVFQFDASRQTTRISANVSGFMNTMRIRLNDNLLNRCSREEVRAVMAHEIGHYVLNHVYESILFIGVFLGGGFAFVRWGFERARQRWGSRWGVSGIGDVAGLPLLVAVLSVYFLVMTPVFNTYIRVNEAEADIYALHASREPEGFAEVALKLSEYRKLDPGPLEEWIFFDHPSGRARIEMAMNWRAEHPAAAP